MPVKSLPSNASLEHLKYQARDLLKALNLGSAEALARTQEFHPGFARMSNDQIRTSKLSLADAQLIIAREYGFDTWPKLKHHIEASAQAAASIVRPTSSFKPPGPVELKQKWPPGARLVRETDLKQNMEIYTPGKADPVKHELSLKYQHAYTVVKELPGGGCEVDLRHLGFRLEVDSGDCLRRYDSAQSSTADQSEIAKVFKTILRAKVRYILGANNRVERMEGVDELVNRLNLRGGVKRKPGMAWDNQALDNVLKRLRSGPRPPLETTDWGMRKMFNEGYFRTKLDPSFLPGKTVQPSDTWTFSRESRAFPKLSIVQEWTVAFRTWEMRADRLCARLEFHGTEKTNLQAEAEAVRRGNFIQEGTFSGVIWFDPELGRGIETNANHDFKVTSDKIAMPAPPAKPAVQRVTDHHHQVIIEKLVSVEGLDGPPDAG